MLEQLQRDERDDSFRYNRKEKDPHNTIKDVHRIGAERLAHKHLLAQSLCITQKKSQGTGNHQEIDKDQGSYNRKQQEQGKMKQVWMKQQYKRSHSEHNIAPGRWVACSYTDM